MLTVLIVDDEPLAHQVLLHHLRSHTDIEVIGQCYNATQALAILVKQRVDLLLLDINMPALSGLDMLSVMANRPQVIIVSAHQEHALKGFELDVCDYLLKPVSAARLATALDKVRSRLALQQSPIPILATSESPSIVVKVDREKRKINLADITLLEAYGNYVKLWQGEQMTLVSSTLKLLLAQLPSPPFLQIHKSFVVNQQHLVALDNDTATLSDGKVVRIGKAFKTQAKTLL
ncbi:LytR/AlgR family response regulator transcription factor [Pseudoalteromonas fenneropenaei]|uniref:LytR/AlgR family response regulator transcription factor n=1 Tax=Pseudoalteromonas fenneropenaei TaxID=1737459 RepID=A0ABV7CEG8_9GAMM